MFLLYRLLWWVLLPFISLYRFYKDCRSPLGLHSFNQRFAIGEFKHADLLIHAVSLGEVRAVTPLVKKIQQEFPLQRILFTTTTLTGSKQVEKSFGNSVDHCFLPLDAGFIMRRFLKKVKPKIILVMETEIWPNFIYQSAQKNIPFYIISACLSDRSYQRFLKIQTTMSSLLNNVSVLAQSVQDVKRFEMLGIQNALRMGNIKFEINIPQKHLEEINLLTTIKDEYLFWIFASSHHSEEEGAINTYLNLRKRLPNLRLIIAPRHPERFNEVATLLTNAKLSYLKRSNTDLSEFTTKKEVWLIDTIGELLTFYAISDITTVAGSFVPIGGHNILEPAYFSKPIIVGEYMHENREIMASFENNNAIITTNFTELPNIIESLYYDKEKRDELGRNAKKCVTANQGASDIVIQNIQKYLR